MYDKTPEGKDFVPFTMAIRCQYHKITKYAPIKSHIKHCGMAFTEPLLICNMAENDTRCNLQSGAAISHLQFGSRYNDIQHG